MRQDLVEQLIVIQLLNKIPLLMLNPKVHQHTLDPILKHFPLSQPIFSRFYI